MISTKTFGASKNIKVLVAEDDPLVSNLVTDLLNNLGYTVVGQALNGRQAVALAQSLRPAVIVMDISMPELDGIEAAQEITEICPTPVVILTAYEAAETVEHASAAGVAGYVVKPPRGRELDRAITIALARFDDLMQLRRLNQKLAESLQQIKTLSGLLPICKSCKKIRDDQGYWQQVEVYVQQHSQARFTHGLCRDCARLLYPDLDL
ncbi:MAG: Chemotaxis response regulator protein-glutamate methylesterase [Anaerolineae bacterium]|nr:Chemotaxis response regulator protein-glutamate methylesterase [Anaerolineae bacterium]